jgi:thiol-disulfide isomerase/thioredoxin
MRIGTLLVSALACAAAARAAAPSGDLNAALADLERKIAAAPAPVASAVCAQAVRSLRLGLPHAAAALERRCPAVPRPAAASAPPALPDLSKRIDWLRTVIDADRPRLAQALAVEIRALPPGPARLEAAIHLASRVTEGDLGAALSAVAAVLADATREAPPSSTAWMILANFVRYEGVRAPVADPSLDAATALLVVREELHRGAGFSLTGLDGRTYSLAALRGRVVMVNFWATWCPPCRKELPDLDRLARRYRTKGLTVLAISDEERETVTKFLAGRGYAFPVLLDPGRKAHAAFDVEGIPNTFVFDRDGRLAAQAIDMRTERQFARMLKAAGLE